MEFRIQIDDDQFRIETIDELIKLANNREVIYQSCLGDLENFKVWLRNTDKCVFGLFNKFCTEIGKPSVREFGSLLAGDLDAIEDGRCAAFDLALSLLTDAAKKENITEAFVDERKKIGRLNNENLMRKAYGDDFVGNLPSDLRTYVGHTCLNCFKAYQAHRDFLYFDVQKDVFLMLKQGFWQAGMRGDNPMIWHDCPSDFTDCIAHKWKDDVKCTWEFDYFTPLVIYQVSDPNFVMKKASSEQCSCSADFRWLVICLEGIFCVADECETIMCLGWSSVDASCKVGNSIVLADKCHINFSPKIKHCEGDSPADLLMNNDVANEDLNAGLNERTAGDILRMLLDLKQYLWDSSIYYMMGGVARFFQPKITKQRCCNAYLALSNSQANAMMDRFVDAERWALLAYELDEGEGAVLLGDFCRRRGMKEQAVEWYHIAANGGCATGFYKLAECNHFGIGCPKDEKSACEYYDEAKSLGCVMAMGPYKF